MSFWGLFGGDVVNGVSDIAKEWIQTDMESAEAKAVMVKALDGNGNMRREISNRVTFLYSVYILVTLFLLGVSFLLGVFEVGKVENVKFLISEVTSLFVPITTLFGLIVSASFGVNGMNSYKGK